VNNKNIEFFLLQNYEKDKTDIFFKIARMLIAGIFLIFTQKLNNG